MASADHLLQFRQKQEVEVEEYKVTESIPVVEFL